MGRVRKLSKKITLSYNSDGSGMSIEIWQNMDKDLFPIETYEIDSDEIFDLIGEIIMNKKISKMEQMSGKEFLESL